ncbi:MAG: radical SAM protein [Proteobacteria bacterium]|nr:radical SAM protein [Pseudomonadota bacterium]
MTDPVSMEIQRHPLWDKLRAKRVPLSFDLEITARCNNDCRHCYICLPPGDAEARSRELTVGEIDHIAVQSVKLGAVWCLVTGGEPLLRPDFEEIYLKLKRRGLLVSVFTNATLINRSHVDLFKKYPPRDIEVTVYGVTKETYERVARRSGTFEKFMHGLNLLLEGGVRVRLKAVPIQSNLAEHDEIAEFCRSRTKDYFRFDPQLHLRFDGDTARNEEIMAERLTPEQIVALELADETRMNAFRKSCDTLICKDLAHVGCNHLFHCGAGNGGFNVSYDGRFRLCASLWSPETLYDLRRGDLADAWNRFAPRVRDMRSNRPEFLKTCHVCPIVNLCMWCPAHAHLETGEMDGPTPYFCAVANARAKGLREIGPG